MNDMEIETGAESEYVNSEKYFNIEYSYWDTK
jgi:hypothetical protein